MILAKVLGFAGVLMTVICQVLLKVAAKKYGTGGGLRFYFNPLTIGGYSGLVLVTLVNLYVFKWVALSYAVVFLASTFLLVGVASNIVLKEKMTLSTVISYAIIVAGVIVYAL